MREPIKIHGKYLRAGQTAKVLGVSKHRAQQLILMMGPQAGRLVEARAGCKLCGKKRISGVVTLRKRKVNGAPAVLDSSVNSYASQETSKAKKRASKSSSK